MCPFSGKTSATKRLTPRARRRQVAPRDGCQGRGPADRPPRRRRPRRLSVAQERILGDRDDALAVGSATIAKRGRSSVSKDARPTSGRRGERRGSASTGSRREAGVEGHEGVAVSGCGRAKARVPPSRRITRRCRAGAFSHASSLLRHLPQPFGTALIPLRTIRRSGRPSLRRRRRSNRRVSAAGPRGNADGRPGVSAYLRRREHNSATKEERHEEVAGVGRSRRRNRAHRLPMAAIVVRDNGRSTVHSSLGLEQMSPPT